MSHMVLEPYLKRHAGGGTLFYSDIVSKFGDLTKLLIEYWSRVGILKTSQHGYMIVKPKASFGELPPNVIGNESGVIGVTIPVLSHAHLIAIERVVGMSPVASLAPPGSKSFMVYELSFFDSLNDSTNFTARVAKPRNLMLSRLSGSPSALANFERVSYKIVCIVVTVMIEAKPSCVRLHYELGTEPGVSWYISA